MKIETMPTLEVEKSEQFKHKAFGVRQQDLSKLIMILREYGYSNKIRSICREVASNARDAHREVGTPDRPIEITVPNEWCSEFIVKDYGPGISPERMSDVFLNYCASTKDNDNTQTGGFGIGAKSPFSYTDSFTIETVTPEKTFTDSDGQTYENCFVKRTYVAHLGEDNIGSCDCLEEVVTKEPQGTTIKVPVHADDYESFYVETVYSTKFWNPQPILKGKSEHKWPEHKPDTKGDGWDILMNGRYGQWVAVLDGIPYDINWANLNIPQELKDQVYDLSGFLYFNTGDLIVTAFRESLEYKKKTTDAIAAKIEHIKDHIKEYAINHIQNAPTYHEAAQRLHNMRQKSYGRVLDNKEEILWNGRAVVEYIELQTEDADAIQFIRYETTYRRTKNYTNSPTSRIHIAGSEFKVYYKDEKIVSRDRLRTLKNADINKFTVIVFTCDDEAKIKALKEKYNLDLLDIPVFSSVEKTKIPSDATKRKYQSFNIKKLERASGFVGSVYRSVVWTGQEEIPEEGVYVILSQRSFYWNGELKRSFDESHLQEISQTLDIDIYRISQKYFEKHKEELEGMVSLEDYLREKEKEYKKYKIVFYENTGYRYSHDIFYSFGFSGLEYAEYNKKIENSNSVARAYLAMSYGAKPQNHPLSGKLAKIQQILGSYKTKKIKFTKVNELFKKTYPLLVNGVSSVPAEEVYEYINMKDNLKNKLDKKGK